MGGGSSDEVREPGSPVAPKRKVRRISSEVASPNHDGLLPPSPLPSPTATVADDDDAPVSRDSRDTLTPTVRTYNIVGRSHLALMFCALLAQTITC